jgi:tetratricopeptide (TPR) repeat protein
MRRILGFILIVLSVIITHLPVSGEEGGGAYYDLGVFSYEDGDYQDAESNLKKALEISPTNPFYNHFLGKTYLKMERYDDAMDYLTRAWEKSPEIIGLKYDIAFLNYKMENFSKAADLFEEILKDEPENVLAHYQAGISLYKEKQYKKALQHFIAASEKSPTIKVWLLLCRDMSSENGCCYKGD